MSKAIRCCTSPSLQSNSVAGDGAGAEPIPAPHEKKCNQGERAGDPSPDVIGRRDPCNVDLRLSGGDGHDDEAVLAMRAMATGLPVEADAPRGVVAQVDDIEGRGCRVHDEVQSIA